MFVHIYTCYIQVFGECEVSVSVDSQVKLHSYSCALREGDTFIYLLITEKDSILYESILLVRFRKKL